MDKEKCQRLINYLKANEGRFVSKEEICENVDGFEKETNPNIHEVCYDIWKCKDYINSNVEEFGWIIISNRKGEIKIPTKEELKESLEREKINKARAWKRLWLKEKALGLIGQTTLNDFIYNVCIEEEGN